MTAPPHHKIANHPLELFPLFRRWPRSFARDLVYTCLWSSMVGVLLAALQALFSGEHGMLFYLLPMVMISNIVGYLIHGGLIGTNVLLRGRPRRLTGTPRLLYYIGMVTLLVTAGIAIGNAILQGRNPLHYLSRTTALAPLLPFALATAVLMFLLSSASERQARHELAAARQREDMAAAAQLLAEARLKALQAQIEPHFLYNTLAGVLSLIDSQPARARHMLERFIDFLRASLAASRAETATVDSELALARAYLDVLAVRMGERLRFTVRADPAVSAAKISPMLIQPLVENAVMHGLEPKVDGGSLRLSARIDASLLCIEVSDDGVGIGNAPTRSGGGLGLSNLKARIRSQYGPAAQLQLLDQPGGGACVRLLLPIHQSCAP